MKPTFGMFPIVVLSLAAGIACTAEKKPQTAITPSEAYKMAEQDTSIVLLDVRSPEEYASETGHLKGALLIPVQDLEKRIDELERHKGRKVIAYCRTGHRSEQATMFLNSHGFTTMNMEGGILRWNKENLPVVKEIQK